MDAIEAIKTRRSVRAYEARAVAREVLMDLVDCARLAPTAMNQQVWEFVVVTDKGMIESLTRTIGHAPWLATAGAAIAVLSKRADYYIEDASSATMNILTAAQAHGLGACWIAGEKQPYAEAVRKLLGAPDGYTFFSLIALGYPAERPVKDKRPLESVMHWEKF